jgi:hypothetical protein
VLISAYNYCSDLSGRTKWENGTEEGNYGELYSGLSNGKLDDINYIVHILESILYSIVILIQCCYRHQYFKSYSVIYTVELLPIFWGREHSKLAMELGVYCNCRECFLVNDQRDAQIPFYLFIFYL